MLLGEILVWLEPEEIVKALSVSRCWRTVGRSPPLWISLLQVRKRITVHLVLYDASTS